MMTLPSLRACLYGCAAASLSLPALAADGGAFELGVVEVIGPRATPPTSKQTVISQSLLRQFNRDTLGEAVGLTPGLSVSRNSRNEDTVYLRGFDIRQVPLFIDGIPAYVPYDGYVDFSRFTTADLAEVRIDKGAASLLYGPNALGGAINLVTRKPTEKLEGDIRAGLAAGNRQQYALNLGSRQDSWYVQLGASYSDSHSFPLSGSYDVRALPTSASNPSRTVLEDGGNRNNAYQTDSRISLKLGFTPNASDEYALGYVRQDGRKGNPPYAGDAPGQYLSIGGGANSRFWQWPYWDLESAYFISNTALGDAHQLKTRVYHDSYRNKILAYSTGSYSTQLSNTSNFPSWYNDSTSGFSVELTSFAINQHVLSLAYHHKIDKHADNGLTLTKRYEDLTRSLALEDRWQLAPAWQLRLGASHDSRSAKEVYYWPTGSTSANNWLAELSHTLHGGAVAYASAARKTRFPTIKDRYSASLGSGLPNAGLTPETALNLELGIKGSPWGGAQGQAALFHSGIRDLMQRVNITPVSRCNQPGMGAATSCTQWQNIAKARHRGVELQLEQTLGSAWKLGGHYTWLDRDNRSGDTPLTDTPRHKLFAYLNWKPSERWDAQLSVDAEHGRVVAYGSGNAASYTTLPGFALANVKLGYQAMRNVRLEAGVNNLFDANYQLSDGYPMPGRVWFVNGVYQF